MAEYFECGHNKGWALRLVDKGHRHMYCLGCIVEKLGIKDMNASNIPKVVEKKKKCNIKSDYGKCVLEKGHDGNHETSDGIRWGPEYEGPQGEPETVESTAVIE